MEEIVSNMRVMDWCLVGALGLVWLLQCYFYIRYMCGVCRKFACAKVENQKSKVESPGVSVIVCARNEAENIDNYVQHLLRQDYPTFEVILVNDSSEDETQAMMERYAQQDPRVKLTFVPHGARLGSTKKFGLTLGAKAAQYDLLLLTDADCCPQSTHWISTMVAPFANPQVEVVLGYGAYFTNHTLLSRLIHYDTLFNGLHYLGSAQVGHPYMGVGRNLAYRKSTFFDRGGFSDQMTKFAGDDDLFVNKVATADNTAVVVGADSLTWSAPKETWKEWIQQKRRHLSVSPSYKRVTKFRLVLEPISRALFYALLIVIGVSAMPLAWMIAGVIVVLRLMMQYIVLNKGAKVLAQQPIGWDLVVLDIVMPVLTLCLMGKKNRAW
ncbi:MAG: glycosyltransferase [Paludibacteraceae bacterium]|nr:glycosyltransferase [Paludibacteraceae bacterium]